MVQIVQPNSTTDRVWADISAAHRYNERCRAMLGYKALSEKAGPHQSHYRSMYEYLQRCIDETELEFLDSHYKWNSSKPDAVQSVVWWKRLLRRFAA